MKHQIPIHEIVERQIKAARGGSTLIDYRQIPPHELKLCLALGERASKIVGQLARERRPGLADPDMFLLGQDFATVHYRCPLRLVEWLTCDDLTFADELGKMMRGLNRVLCIFDVSVNLRFARIAH